MNNFKTKTYELTQGQQSLWIGQQLNNKSTLRNVIYTFDIQGSIDCDIFQKSFIQVIKSVEALRTVFKEDDPQNVRQIVFPEMEYDLEVVDLPESIDDDNIDSWLLKKGNVNFDVSKCIFKTFLVRLAENRYIWFLNLHHLIADTISVKIIYNLTKDNYSALLKSHEETTKHTPSIREYIQFEKEKTPDSKSDSSKVYWSRKTKEPNKIINLYGKPNTLNTNKSTRIRWNLGTSTSKKLREIAQKPDIRSFTDNLTLLNIFSSLLFAYLFKSSNQNKITIGITNQNRATKTFKETVGYFIQIFPLLCEVDEGDNLLNIVKRTKLEINSNLMHQKPGLATPEMNRSYNVLLNYINTSFSDFSGFTTKTKWLHSGHIDSSHYFQFHITDFNATGNYELILDLNNEVFNAERRYYAKQHLSKIFEAFILNQKAKLSEIHLTTEAELNKIKQWNNTSITFEKGETLLSKFERQVSKIPSKTALVYNEQIYTYDNLNRRANQVANFLVEKDIEKGDIVAVSLERSIEMLVFIYGILKAGAAYLPIDTYTPSERLRFIANDAKFKILFFNHNRLSPEELDDVECFNIETIRDEISSFEVEKPQISVSPENLAYIIYTSGSTGKPKGVLCHHKGICNRLNWMNKAYPLSEKDTLIQKTPVTFDVSLWELFWPLQQGAKLVIELPQGHKNPVQLIASINRHNVTVIHFVPSMLNAFIQAEEVKSCSSLKKIFCSGEALSVNTVEMTYKQLSDIEIHNLYGPTEASVDVTSWHCTRESLRNGVPIGYPISNTQIYIVDSHLNLVPLGVKGEICIGGIQVAAGYLNREKLSSDKFIDDIFSNRPGAKLYKTGDIARYRDDGAIEYLGRSDDQIKLRGFRIELGEIEKTIERLQNVVQASVITNSKENLVAFYSGDFIDESSMKNKLFSMLPDYMVPFRIIHIEEFPLSKNGKIDRSSLMERVTAVKESSEVLVDPKNEIEELLVNIWMEVLKIDQIGVHDNFIDLGGHSLAAIRITTRINEEIELKFPLNKVFELPTVALYSEYIEKTLLSLLNQRE